MTAREPRPGDIYYIGAKCGVPFTWAPIMFSVLEVPRQPASARWSTSRWLIGYQLNQRGHPQIRREIYVITAGLDLVAKSYPMEQRRRSATPRQRTQPTNETRTGAPR